MKKVSPLSNELKSLITDVYENGKNHTIKQRAHGILLNDKGKTVQEICDILDVDRHTVCNWIDRFENEKMNCFIDLPHLGRKHILTPEEEEEIAQHQIKSYLSMSMMKAFILERFGKTISSETIKRLYKKKSCLETDASKPKKETR